MRFLNRQGEQHTTENTGGAAPDNLAAVREQGSELLRAADEAINRALAGSNSETFLRAGRQQGGQ